MKHSYLLAIMFTVLFINVQAQNIEFDVNAQEEFRMNTDGFDPIFQSTAYNYGILGTNDAILWRLWVNRGQAFAWDVISDERKKENIRDLQSVSSKLTKVKTVKYNLKDDPRSKREAPQKEEIGFLAQDLMKEFPEVVNYDEKADLYTVNYNAMVPVLIKAFKEQQAEIEALKTQMANGK